FWRSFRGTKGAARKRGRRRTGLESVRAQTRGVAVRDFRAHSFDHSRRTTLKSEFLILSPPLYSMNPSLRNLFMKKLTRDRVVPIISARVSWLTLGITASGFPSFPKLAKSKRSRARRFSLELNS